MSTNQSNVLQSPRWRPRRSVVAEGQMSALIERLAVSPEADPAKLDRLLSYQERAHRDKARAAFGAAYTKLQLALPVLAENGEIRDRAGRVQHTYALWEDINEVIKPILFEYGFSLRFKIENADRQVCVTGEFGHIDGHTETSTLKLPVDLSGGKSPVQAIGSSTSYGKRYVAAALLNLTSRGEDDDGAYGPEEARIDQDQAQEILDLLGRRGISEGELLAYLDLGRLQDLPASRFDRTLEAINLRGTPA